MLTIKTMPKDALGELVAFIAESEPLTTVREQLAGGMTVEEVRAALRELAVEIKKESVAEYARPEDLLKDRSLTKKSRDIFSCLSSYEEKKLLKAFGLIEGN